MPYMAEKDAGGPQACAARVAEKDVAPGTPVASVARNADFSSLRLPLPDDIARLKGAGRLTEAARACRARLREVTSSQLVAPAVANADAPASAGAAAAPAPPDVVASPSPSDFAARLRIEALRLDRLAAQYPVSRAEALATLRKECPGIRMADLERLERAGRIDWRVVDGEVRYLASWLRSLRLHASELPGLVAIPGEGADRDAVIAEMRTDGSAARDITLHATLALPGIPPGGAVRAWLPVAAACPQHPAAELLAATDGAMLARSDAPQRAVFWESGTRRTFDVTYRVHVRSPYVDLWSERGIELARQASLALSGVPVHHPGEKGAERAEQASPASSGTPAPLPCEKDLAPLEPHVVFTPLVLGTAVRIAREVIGHVPNLASAPFASNVPLASHVPSASVDPSVPSARLAPREQLELARAVYDFLTREVDYRFQPAYAQLECIADAVLANRRADCGMFTIAFISLCRVLGIPARWQSGLEVSPAHTGPHDWAMFHVDGIGWLGADCCFGSAARQEGNEARRRHYFGNLDPCRVVFNRELFADFEPASDGVRSDPFDNQLGEATADGRGLDEFEMCRAVELVGFH